MMTGDELWLDAELEKNKFKEKQVGGTNPTIFVRTAQGRKTFQYAQRFPI